MSFAIASWFVKVWIADQQQKSSVNAMVEQLEYDEEDEENIEQIEEEELHV